MGGVFNTVNASLYHYAGNNPVRYTDPDGRSIGGKLLGYSCYVAAGLVLAGGAVSVPTGQLYLTVGAAKLSFALAAAGVTILVADAINDANKNRQASLLSGFNRGTSASTASPSPLPPDPDDKNDDNRCNENSSNKLSQSAKDAKKLDNKGADNLAKEKGYENAHDLKEGYVGKDNISKFDIYRNNKTGESFLIKKQGAPNIIPIME